MTERITLEQATGKPPSHVLSSALIDAANSLFCKLLEYEREIERLQGDLAYLIEVLEGIRDADNPESAPYKAIGALVALTLRAGTDTALAPLPAREEGVTP